MATFTLEGIHPVHTTPSGKWGVVYKGINWYVVNLFTGQGKKVGPAKMKGVNYFDRAVELAKEREEHDTNSKMEG